MPSGGTISSAPLPPIASTPAPPERSDWWPAASFDTFKRSSSPWAGGSPASTLLTKHTCTRTHRQLRLHLALQRESGGLAPAPPAPAPPAPPRPLHHLVFLFSECSYFPVGSAGLTPETGSVLCPATRSGARLSEPVRQLSDVSVPTSASSKALLVTGRTGPIPVQAARGRKGEGTWREAQSAPATHDCLPLSGSRLRCLGCQGRGERGRGARGCRSPPRDPTADSRPHVHLLLLRVSYLRAPDRWVPKPQSLTPPPPTAPPLPLPPLTPSPPPYAPPKVEAAADEGQAQDLSGPSLQMVGRSTDGVGLQEASEDWWVCPGGSKKHRVSHTCKTSGHLPATAGRWDGTGRIRRLRIPAEGAGEIYMSPTMGRHSANPPRSYEGVPGDTCPGSPWSEWQPPPRPVPETVETLANNIAFSRA